MTLSEMFALVSTISDESHINSRNFLQSLKHRTTILKVIDYYTTNTYDVTDIKFKAQDIDGDNNPPKDRLYAAKLSESTASSMGVDLSLLY